MRKPMRWACSRKHWRHMKMWYFRMRPVWLEHTRLHIQAERRAEPGQSGKRTTSAAAGWAGGWRAHHWRPPLADLVLWVKMRFGITGAVDPLTCLPPRAPLCKARASDELEEDGSRRAKRAVGTREGKPPVGATGAGKEGRAVGAWRIGGSGCAARTCSLSPL